MCTVLYGWVGPILILLERQVHPPWRGGVNLDPLVSKCLCLSYAKCPRQIRNAPGQALREIKKLFIKTHFGGQAGFGALTPYSECFLHAMPFDSLPTREQLPDGASRRCPRARGLLTTFGALTRPFCHPATARKSSVDPIDAESPV